MAKLNYGPIDYISYAAPYIGPFDKTGYSPVYGPSLEEVMPVPEEEKESLTKLPPSKIGISANPFAHPIQALQERLRQGASKVEFTFFGAGKGNKQSFTPESLGKVERRALKDLAKINEAEVTTHATVQVAGLAGFNPEAYRFSDQYRNQALKEIAKAIDFAADATTGGAIVVHTSEFPRKIEEAEVSKEGPRFLSFPLGMGVEKPEEIKKELAKERPLYFVDKETGEVKGFRLDQEISIPEVEEIIIPGEGGKEGKIEIQKWEEKENGVKVKVPKIKQVPLYELWEKAREKYGKEIRERKMTPEAALVKYIQEDAIKAYEAEARRFLNEMEETKERIELLKKERERLLRLKEEYEKRGLQKEWERETVMIGREGGLTPPKVMHRLEAVEKELERAINQLRWQDEYASSAAIRLRNIEKALKNIAPIKDYAIEKTADTLARAGIMAMEKTQQVKKKEK
ncbi:hypothetical protein J7K74_01755, partial [Candidatus Woesearchaeota archaeon]|nr:hypothetical protein [Candidatus Woesearchaeota archaeon]